jgi:hypothetical protein
LIPRSIMAEDLLQDLQIMQGQVRIAGESGANMTMSSAESPCTEDEG